MKTMFSFFLLATLVLAGCTTSRTVFTNAQVIGPYSPAVKIGNTLYLSGQIAMKPGTTELAADDIEVQTRQVLENIKSLLAGAGYEMSDVVQCVVYMRDMKEYGKMNQVYGSFFTAGRFPTRTAVEVSNLPRNARIEITAVASR